MGDKKEGLGCKGMNSCPELKWFIEPKFRSLIFTDFSLTKSLNFVSSNLHRTVGSSEAEEGQEAVPSLYIIFIKIPEQRKI